MSVNNEMYALFRTMKEGYASDRYDVMESAARCWLMFDPENPFKAETPEHEAFFQMQRCFTIWRNGDINGRINKKRMVEYAKQLCSLNPKQPYKFDKTAEQAELKAGKEEKKEEIKKDLVEEIKEDTDYYIGRMLQAYKSNNEESFEVCVEQLMETADRNPYALGTDEYELFSTMKTCYMRVPQNIKKTISSAKQLCALLNGEEIAPKESEKKSWLKFLFPWKKEGESDDGFGTD